LWGALSASIGRRNPAVAACRELLENTRLSLKPLVSKIVVIIVLPNLIGCPLYNNNGTIVNGRLPKNHNCSSDKNHLF
jgi:hypothetical protein